MADEPKPAPKPAAPAPTPSGSDPFIEIVSIVAGGFFLVYVLNMLIAKVGNIGIFSHGFAGILEWLSPALFVLKIVSVVISLGIIAELTYIVRKLTALRENERKLLYPEIVHPLAPPGNPKWERILAHSESQNETDWRLAILEADIMLWDLLDQLSLPGETMADKLKAVEKSDFQTIENAWEGHKIRNQIAHEGVDFQLSQRETRRVIELYRQIFDEFKMI